MPKYEEYDYVVVGLGYAGAIVTARLAERNPDAKILAIEYGGAMQAATGGATRDDVDMEMTAKMFQEVASDPTKGIAMPDVPGNYNNVAFRPLAEAYFIKPRSH